MQNNPSDMQTQRQRANENIMVGTGRLTPIKSLIIRFECQSCHKITEESIPELYCHFPIRHPLDNSVASFAIPTFKCMDCLFKSEVPENQRAE